MTLAITHTTPADGTFSTTGAAAWDAAHSLGGAADVSQGGTGATTLTGYVKGNGTAAMTASATVPSGDITGLGTMATQNANAVAITGGTVNGATVGATTAAAGTFTSITDSGLTSGRVTYAGTAGVLQDSANLTFNGTTLTNTGNAIISDNSANAALRVTQVGAGNALLVEDSANPDATPFVIDASGNVGIGTTTPNGQFEIVNSGNAVAVARSTGLTNGSYFLAAGYDYFSGPSYRATQLIQYNVSATGTALGLNNANLGVLSFQNASNAAIFTNSGNILRIGTASTTAISIASNQVISLGAAAGSESLRVTPVASAVNYLNVVGAITTASPAIQAAGSDANINVILTPKGTGVLQFGTYTAGILAQSGYITIKDAGVTTRNLLVG